MHNTKEYGLLRLLNIGIMAERSKAVDSRSTLETGVGSNPTDVKFFGRYTIPKVHVWSDQQASMKISLAIKELFN